MSEESRNPGKDLRDSEITDAIIAADIAVHRELGPGFLESIYEQALAVEFALRDCSQLPKSEWIGRRPCSEFFDDAVDGETSASRAGFSTSICTYKDFLRSCFP